MSRCCGAEDKDKSSEFTCPMSGTTYFSKPEAVPMQNRGGDAVVTEPTTVRTRKESSMNE